MVRTTGTWLAVGLLVAMLAASAHAGQKQVIKVEPDCEKAPHPGHGDGYPLGFGFGWTSKYYAVGGCPGWQKRPCNPFLGVPFYSSLGQTGPRRMLLWPPQVGSPLYNNTPRLVPYPPGARPCHGVNCPY